VDSAGTDAEPRNLPGLRGHDRDNDDDNDDDDNNNNK
jgi:hypothetical protein